MVIYSTGPSYSHEALGVHPLALFRPLPGTFVVQALELRPAAERRILRGALVCLSQPAHSAVWVFFS